MNKYDNIMKQQKIIKENFLNTKTREQINRSKELILKLNNQKIGLNKDEYIELLQYYFSINYNNLKLTYDRYFNCKVELASKEIPFYSMKKKDLCIHDKLIRATFIL